MIKPAIRPAIFDSVYDVTSYGGAGGNIQVTDVPQSEADALIAFYNATGGDSWTDNTNWLTDPVVNNWYGITVSGGHVTKVVVLSNNLVGAVGNTLNPIATSLIELRCQDNSITTLDVSSLTALTQLNCQDNFISVLDVSNLTSLNYLYCYGNSISTLDVSSLTSLFYLYCYDNSISVLDVSSLTSLSRLYCYDNSIATLDVSSLTSLTRLYCFSNSMSESTIDTILCALDTGGNINGVCSMAGTNSAPSAAGIACKDNLVTDGWTVTITE